MAEERWLPVVGWEGFYEVSDQGRVRSLDRVSTRNGRPYRQRGRILKPWPTPPMGYLSVGLHGDGAVRRVRVHTLVLEAFVGPRPEGLVACHGPDGHRVNTPANLRWDTQPENCRDILRHGVHHNTAKTRCKRGGHEFTTENTYINPTSGGRQCRKCLREVNQRSAVAKRAAKN